MAPYYPGYQPMYYQPPMADQLTQLRQQQYQAPMPGPQMPPQSQPASNGIIWVQGEEGAKGYLVAPGENRLLMDSENSTFYIKSTDPSGMPMPLRIFDYTERTAARTAPQAAQESVVQFATKDELNALAARLDALAAQKQPVKKPAAKEETSNA